MLCSSPFAIVYWRQCLVMYSRLLNFLLAKLYTASNMVFFRANESFHVCLMIHSIPCTNMYTDITYVIVNPLHFERIASSRDSIEKNFKWIRDLYVSLSQWTVQVHMHTVWRVLPKMNLCTTYICVAIGLRYIDLISFCKN